MARKRFLVVLAIGDFLFCVCLTAYGQPPYRAYSDDNRTQIIMLQGLIRHPPNKGNEIPPNMSHVKVVKDPAETSNYYEDTTTSMYF